MSIKKENKNDSSINPNNDAEAEHEEIKLDDLDKTILRELQKDGKLSLRELSKKTGSSVTAVKNHLDKLSDKKVIKDYIAIIDCCKVGYNEMLLVNLKIDTHFQFKDIFDQLTEIEAINAIYQISGEYPIFCIIKCVNKQEQISVIESIKKLDGITDLVTQVVMQRVKEDFRIKIP